MTSPRPLPIFQLPLGEGVAHYLDTRTSAPALLLIHGAPGRPQDFRFMVPHLAGKLRVIAPGMPGQGLTPMAAGRGTSLSERVAFLAGFVDALGLESVLIGGHSMGGALAIALAAALEERARGLVLMASFGLSPHRGLRRSRPALAAALLGSPLQPLLIPAAALAFRAMGFPAGVPPESMLHTIRCAADTDFTQLRGALQRAQVPTLVASADDDHLIEPAIAQALGEAAARGPRLRFATGGHGIVKTRARALAEAIQEWDAAQARS